MPLPGREFALYLDKTTETFIFFNFLRANFWPCSWFQPRQGIFSRPAGLAVAQTACRSSKNTPAWPPCRGKLAETMIKAQLLLIGPSRPVYFQPSLAAGDGESIELFVKW
jgi:hypothetical protein